MLLSSPAALRNRELIADVLAAIMPASGRVVEVASGSGEHVVCFAQRFAQVQFQPSDVDSRARASIDAHARLAALGNIDAAIELDATAPSWPVADLDGLININMIHISPWQACTGLLERASHAIKGGGFLFLYGPYIRDDVETAPSNLSFDRSLRSRDPSWGVRNLVDVRREAESRGFTFERLVEMPANNVSVVFRRTT